MMDKIIDAKVREKALEQARRDQREDITQRRLDTFYRCLRMTAGVAFNAGTVELTDGRVHQRVIEQTKQREQSELQAVQRRQQQLEVIKNKVDAIRQKNKQPTKWNASELHTMVSWFKRPGDSNIPKKQEELLQRYLLTCKRSEQEPRRKKDDEPPVVDRVPPAAAQDAAAAAAFNQDDAATADQENAIASSNQDASTTRTAAQPIEDDAAAALLTIGTLTAV